LAIAAVTAVNDKPLLRWQASEENDVFWENVSVDTMKTAVTDEIGELLKRTKTIAVVGLSDSPLRPSYGVSAYMQTQGYRIIPVNPSIKGALGEKAVASLAEVGEKIDVVDVFRRSEFVPEVVDEAIRLKVPAIWLQEGVIHEEAAERARKAGIFVVMDRCILKEHRRRFQ
jgi:predicted CoA-binding protein